MLANTQHNRNLLAIIFYFDGIGQDAKPTVDYGNGIYEVAVTEYDEFLAGSGYVANFWVVDGMPKQVGKCKSVWMS